jgi:hypothetical protein
MAKVRSKEDYKKILEKLKEGQGGGNYNKLEVEYLDLKPGKNNVRVLPGHPNMEAFFVEKHQHQKGTGPTYMSVICLNHGDHKANECLICSEELEELRLSKDKDDKKKYSDQRPKVRYFLSVIDRDDDEKLKVLPCGSQILTGILEYVTDEDEYGDILDAQEGRDLIITKSGSGMDTEYTVKSKVKSTPIFDEEDEITKLIGTSAEDTKLPDLTVLTKEMEGEPENALYIWRNGWKAFADKMKSEGGGDSKKADTKKPAGKGKPVEPEEEPDAEGEEDETPITDYPVLKSRCAICGEKRHKTPNGNLCPNGHSGDPLAEGAQPTKPSKAYLKEFPPAEPEETPITSFPKLKSRCAVCGDVRYNAPDGATCAQGHGGPKLADGARPAKPSKAYLKEFPEPVEEDEEAEEEAPAPKPKTGVKPAATPSKTAPAKTSPSKPAPPEDDEEEGLDDLDAILAKHKTVKK